MNESTRKQVLSRSRFLYFRRKAIRKNTARQYESYTVFIPHLLPAWILDQYRQWSAGKVSLKQNNYYNEDNYKLYFEICVLFLFNAV